MKQDRFFLYMLIISVTASLSCSPAIKTVSSWTNKEKIHPPYKSVFITVLTPNLQTKTILESDLATAAMARGLKAYKSADAFGPVTSKQSMPVKEAFLKKVNDLGCETILTIALVDHQSETKYVPASSMSYTPYSYAGYGGYGMYGGFGGYYAYSSSTMYSPGYYTTKNTYFLECNLYDPKTEELLMTIQSKAKNPAEIEKSSKEYTQTLVDEIESLKSEMK